MIQRIGRKRGLKIGKQGRAVGYFDWFGAGFSLTIKQGLHMATLRRLMPRLVADVFVLFRGIVRMCLSRLFVHKKN